MYRKICCLVAVIATLLCLCVAVQATEESASYKQLSANVDGLTIEQDMLLDLNGHHVINATVEEGVTLRLMDSANDGYDASKCGSFSGTIDGTVEQLVKHDAKNYLVIEDNGVYSAHRYYAGITKISLAPNQVALGYKAEYYADEVINEMVTGYGYELWVNELNPVQRMKEGNITDHELTLRLKNILVEGNDTLSNFGVSANIQGRAFINFDVAAAPGAAHTTTLKEAVEAVNTALGQDRSAYTKDQIQSVRDLINKFNSYMNTWEQEYIFTEEKFVAVENVSATYGDALNLGQVFTAVEGVTIGENVTVTVNGEAIEVADNWADTALNLNAGEAVITITDNERCWTAANTVAVAKADPSYELPTDLTATYGDTLADVELPEGFTWVDSAASVGNAGTQTHSATYNAGANYNTVEVTVTVEVAKADIAAPAIGTLSATYGDTLADVKLPEGFTWADNTASVGNAGTNSFTATYTPADTTNYNTAEVTISVEVAKANPTYTAPTGLTATYGDDLASVTLPAGFTWESTGTVGNAGENKFTVTYTPDNTDNYNVITGIEVTVAVAKANATCTAPTANALTYTGNEQALITAGTANGGSMVYSLTADGEFASDLPTATNAGAYTVYYKVVGDANHNDTQVSSVTVTIAKAESSVVTAPTANELTYTGNEQALVTAGTATGGKLVYKLGDGEYSETIPTATAAGTYTVYYKVEGDANHNDSAVASVTVEIKEVQKVDKFAISLYEDEPAFLYRVGNVNAVKLGSLFKALDNADVGTVSVEIETLAGNVTGVYTANATWTNATIKFTGTGVVKVTISDEADNTIGNPVSITLEVVNATNVTQYSELGNRNSVLLNNITMSSGGSYSLTSGNTLYGNGFTFDVTDGAYSGTGYITANGLIYLNSSNLDNVQIIGAVYTAYGATSSADYNRSTVSVQGNCTIANCYISNCASPIRVHDGNVEIINTTLKGGNYANLDIRNGNIVLDNVTTINQVKDNDLATDGTVVCGLGIVFHYEQVLDTTTLEIRNGLHQYNYFSETQANTYIRDEKASTLTETMFSSSHTDLQYPDADGEKWVNAGIIAMCDTVSDDNITDVDGYTTKSVTLLGKAGLVHTCVPTADAIAAEVSAYETAGQYAISPAYSFDYTTKNYVEKTEGSNDYCYYSNGAVMLSMDEGDSVDWDTSILTATKNGETLPYTVTMNGTDYSGKTITFNTTGNYTVTYTYTDSNNYGLDADGNVTTYDKSYTKTVRIQVAAVKAAAKHAEFTFGSNNVASTTVTIGNDTYVMPDVTATSDTIGSKTVSGTTVYMPIINCAASNNKTSQTSGTTWYMLFPVFKNVVTITDYADGGTGDAVTYNSSTTTLPSGLAAVNPSTTFQYASASEAPETPAVYSNVLYYTSPAMEGVNRESYTIDAKYTYKDNAGFTYCYYVRYITPKITNTSCVTGDTLVTLANGAQKQIKDVTYSDQLLVWDFYKGEYAAVPSAIIFDHGYGNNTVIKLKFSDGTSVNVVNLHQFMDATENRFVTVDAQSVARYVGHEFVKQDGDGYKTVMLTEYAISQEYVEAYGIITAGHYNLMVNGMWSTDFMPEDYDLFNYFAIGENMMFDQEAMAADIAAYGLYTYEDFADYLTYEQFVGFNVQFFKISVGKGLYTYEGILNLIETYLNA